MAWLKDVYLDIAILVIVIIFAVFTNQALKIVLWVYTALLLISKGLIFFMPSLKKRASKTGAPNLFYHVIYLATIAIFVFINHYYLAAAWLVIWIASALQIYNKKS